MAKNKLTIIKVGGKIVEEPETLNQLLEDFSNIEGYNSWCTEEEDRLRAWRRSWALKAKW